LFEELAASHEEQGVPSQRLLLAQTFELAPRDAEWWSGMPRRSRNGMHRAIGRTLSKIDSLRLLDVSDR